MTDEASNLPEISVSDLSGAIKRTVEDAFGYVRVRGEISGYRGPSASGHVYFGLKDQSAKIDAVIWKGVFGRMKVRPEDGLEVIATGKVSTFPGSSKYQLIIEAMEPAGVGALLAQLEERRKRLAAEGLFDAARKQLLPYMPRVVGVVTSPTGAVIRDIIHRISDRFPLHILVWPVRVQGETSSAEVAAGIRGFNALEDGGAIPMPDVIVVARGGGSLEDLWGFNDEIVVRAAATSDIPLVSAVGHETDWTLIDQAADLRAPTPTGAAEMIVPVRSELLATAGDLGNRLNGGLRRLVERRKSDLRSVARALPTAENLLAQPRQRLDVTGAKLPSALQQSLQNRRVRLSQLETRLQKLSPRTELAKRRVRLDSAAERLQNALAGRLSRAKGEINQHRERVQSISLRMTPAMQRYLINRADRLKGTAKLFDSLNYTSVLKRGFALVRDEHGQPLRHVAMATAGSRISVQVADGAFDAVVGGTPQPRKPAKAAAAPPLDDLFG
ncbi:MAG: exodeoxyribonuclease VII large subunit [Beijerinckiaceae bacterium]